MRVGINLLPIGPRAGGIGRQAVELPAALLDVEPSLSITVFGSRELPTMPWEDRVDVVRLPVGSAGRVGTIAQLGLPIVTMGRGLDVLHSIANVGPPGIPGLPPSIVTVHDAIWAHVGTEWGTPEAVRAMERLAFRSARWATRVQVDSQATADDLVTLGGVDSSRIDVVPLGVTQDPGEAVPERELRARLGVGDRPVVLAVAQKRPYKNLAAAIRTLVEISEVALVLPGSPTAHEDELRALAKKLHVADRVLFPEWVSEEELEGLYAIAACVVVPSFVEGFGLPVLEAMVRGVPVACSRTSSLVEVAGDAAIMFDPGSDTEVAAAVARIVRDGDLRSRLSASGREQAAKFTWRRCAERTLASYRSVCR